MRRNRSYPLKPGLVAFVLAAVLVVFTSVRTLLLLGALLLLTCCKTAAPPMGHIDPLPLEWFRTDQLPQLALGTVLDTLGLTLVGTDSGTVVWLDTKAPPTRRELKEQRQEHRHEERMARIDARTDRAEIRAQRDSVKQAAITERTEIRQTQKTERKENRRQWWWLWLIAFGVGLPAIAYLGYRIGRRGPFHIRLPF